MKLLLLSFYYPPDLCAGSFRCDALVKALRQTYPELQIDVLTTQPNRYRHNNSTAPAVEINGNLRVRRLALPGHDSGMVDQARAFTTYLFKALRTLRNDGPYDAVFATSSRLMTGSLGALVARRLKIPLYLDIRDLFADTIKDVLPGRSAKTLRPAIRFLEGWTFRSAARINVVSEGFVEHVRKVAKRTDLRTYTNGIDDEFLREKTPFCRRAPSERILLVYAGNVGEGQGLHRIIPDVARRLGERALFRIIGHGGRIGELREQIGGDVSNIEILPPVARAELHKHYAEADILFLHLNDYPAFDKVLPSKIFEYAATGKRIVAGVSGYSARFIQENISGAEIFYPCDADGMVRSISAVLEIPYPVDRAEFVAKYARRNVMKLMAEDIVDFIQLTPNGKSK